MRCNKCGDENPEYSKFCSTCGGPLEQANHPQQNNAPSNIPIQSMNNSHKRNNNNKQGILSIVLGFLAGITALFLRFFAIGLPIAGIILGVKTLKKGQKGLGIAGIVLNIIGFFAVVIIQLAFIGLEAYDITGTLECINYPKNTTDANTINQLFNGQTIKYQFNKDKTFTVQYGENGKDGYITGTYKKVDVKAKDEAIAYTINMTANYRNIGGKTYNEEYTTQYEIVASLKNKNEYAMINTVSYSMYYCRKQ